MTTWPPAESLVDLSSHQREQYANAAQGHLSLLCGRPGTGKTYTLARTLARILKALPKANLAVAAPTGKAAVRITESLNRAGVSGMRASTIHSLLGVKSANGTWEFKHDEKNPLPLDWIFVDEGSMLSTPLFASLLAARCDGCRVLVIGDVNQLSPVEHGAPLRDLREILPHGDLVEIQRNSGRIVKACHEIIDKQTFTPSPKLAMEDESPENLLHIERGDSERQIEALRLALTKFGSGQTLPVRQSDGQVVNRIIDPVWDCQVITPLNTSGDVARVKLNKMLQGLLNPSGVQSKHCPFRIGDKVVCGKNSWVPIEEARWEKLGQVQFNVERDAEGRKVFVCNGDVGQVVAIETRYIVVRLYYPARLVRVPLGESYENEEGEEEREGFSWDLAYAMSLHKAQGSDFPVAIGMVDDSMGARMLCDRSYWYTMLSRASLLACTIGKRRVIEDGILKSHIWKRKTFLVEQVKELQTHSLGVKWARELGGL